jgi:hypothetical protein
MDERIKSAISSLLEEPALKGEMSFDEAFNLARIGLQTAFPKSDFNTVTNLLAKSDEDLRNLLLGGILLGLELVRSKVKGE